MNTERSVQFNDGWSFALLPVASGFDKAVICNSWKEVSIPHDWLIYDTDNLYKSGEGWYKKTFYASDIGSYVWSLDFDGVYMDSTVYVNGKEAGTWRNGYASFSFDISELISDGDNEVMVQVRYISPNSRWYSGAGIYRNVYLTKTNHVHINRNGVYISAYAESGNVLAETSVNGEYDRIVHTVLDMDGKAVVSHTGGENASFSVNDFRLWNLDSPYLYTLRTELYADDRLADTVENVFGFRSIHFDPDEGFFLNGEYMKLKGVCMHHDLGALGSAMNYHALERQLKLMKSMGANAVRTSHNMAAREFIDICDRIGLLVNSESYDMWELPKTEFDNARFFKETAHEDVLSWVMRDRNHPCVIMWSIGNEIYDTHASAHGYEIAERLAGYVREADKNRNAVLTIGSNYIEWDNAQKIGDMLVHSGYNYTERCYDEHHKKHPNTVIYGSETASAVRSRGIYHFPSELPLLSHDDNQCSSLENSYVGWGRSAEDAWLQDRNRKFCAGQFVWTGIDYIGEPTPYSTKNSYFGAVDTAGIPKDAYYFYRSVWTDCKKSPMIHLLPYWDFNVGQIIDVIAYTNLPYAELFLNGCSLGRQHIEHLYGDILHAHWKVPYQDGVLEVKGIDNNGEVIVTDTQKSFGDPIRIDAVCDKTEMLADGKDLCFVEISTADENGTYVANARNRISVEVSGAGYLLGLDNGDSTDYEQYKSSNRRLFSGKLIAIVGSCCEKGEVSVKLTSNGLKEKTITVKVNDCTDAGYEKNHFEQISYIAPADDIPVRKIEVVSCDRLVLNENKLSAQVKLRILPLNATFGDLTCKVVKENSVETDFVNAEIIDDTVNVFAKGDGEGILRIYAFNGGKYPQVISDIAVTATGLGCAVRNPYEFISACTYSESNIPVNIIENGALGGFTKPCKVCYNSFDFGNVGSEKCRLFVGNAQNRDIPIELTFSGTTQTLMFPHNNGWGSFEPYDFNIDGRIIGQHDILFNVSDKCIFGGFEFIPEEKAYAKLFPAYNDSIYGDDFTIVDSFVEGIGNNVVIEFHDMDFADGASKLEIFGRTPNDINTVQLRVNINGTAKTVLLEFEHADEYILRSFELGDISGKADISFVFMPGSRFDFGWFRFIV